MIISFIWMKVHHLFHFNKKHIPLTSDILTNAEQKPIAVMIACWQEAPVIASMLEMTLARVKYQNYVLFVGTYPNDPETIAQVRRVQEKHQQVELVVLKHDGPTTKSDNINAIREAIFDYEKKRGIEFQIFVIHDAEDHVPEWGLSIFNHLIPRKDVVQLPVLPLKEPWYEWVAATYMDEFAHLHLMGMRTREWISDSIPTSGVGCGFSREFLSHASARNNDLGPLGLETLTEDYELPLLNKRKHNGEIFFDSIITKEEMGKRWVTYVPAVRSHFPKSFKKAVIQKSRWLLGITLQGGESLGWRGSLRFKYMLFRDRKPIVTNVLTLIGLVYLLVFFVDMFVRGESLFVRFNSHYNIIESMIMLNLFLMFILILVRGICSTLVYGPIHGILSLPRILVGNMINGMAALRALTLYTKNRINKTAPKWEKTDHEI